MAKSAQRLIAEAIRDAMAVASGPFTPIVFELYEQIGGERGVMIGRPDETLTGHKCIVWTSRAEPRPRG